MFFTGECLAYTCRYVYMYFILFYFFFYICIYIYIYYYNLFYLEEENCFSFVIFDCASSLLAVEVCLRNSNEVLPLTYVARVINKKEDTK